MNPDFSRVISLLRKERNISQKTAAMELGISQGLLSHYEKGKRECGLDFLVKIADYYEVSCDYILGRSPEPQGKTISVDEIPSDDASQKERIGGGLMIAVNKKLITNSLNLLFSLVQKSGSNVLAKEVSSYLMLCVYQMVRILYSTNSKNDENFFTVPKSIASQLTDSAMSFSKGKAEAAASGNALNGNDILKKENMFITTDLMSKEFPVYYSSAVNLIKNSEAKIKMILDSEL